MARYVDIDDFRKNAYYADTDIDIGVYLAEHGCADVAPRAEVDGLRELNNSLLEAGQAWQKRYENLAREIFEEIERSVYKLETPYQVLHCIPTGYLAELKKKYTEVQK